MVMYGYFETHAKLKTKRINRKRRNSSPNDPNAEGKDYREDYGL